MMDYMRNSNQNPTLSSGRLHSVVCPCFFDLQPSILRVSLSCALVPLGTCCPVHNRCSVKHLVVLALLVTKKRPPSVGSGRVERTRSGAVQEPRWQRGSVVEIRSSSPLEVSTRTPCSRARENTGCNKGRTDGSRLITVCKKGTTDPKVVLQVSRATDKLQTSGSVQAVGSSKWCTVSTNVGLCRCRVFALLRPVVIRQYR